MEQIILASGSPRRRELMALAGIPCRIMVSGEEEIMPRGGPEQIVEELSARKAEAVAAQIDRGWVIGADTIVWARGEALGKPRDRKEAADMLRRLSGRGHSVFTGVTLLRKTPEEQRSTRFCCETRVYVHRMSEEEIGWYIRTGEPFDKAGGYGIQGPFAVFIDRIEGDYQNVVGLPVSALYQELKKAGWTRE